jgi:hypothetical protein
LARFEKELLQPITGHMCEPTETTSTCSCLRFAPLFPAFLRVAPFEPFELLEALDRFGMFERLSCKTFPGCLRLAPFELFEVLELLDRFGMSTRLSCQTLTGEGDVKSFIGIDTTARPRSTAAPGNRCASAMQNIELSSARLIHSIGVDKAPTMSFLWSQEVVINAS